jgi:hypothetical protein
VGFLTLCATPIFPRALMATRVCNKTSSNRQCIMITVRDYRKLQLSLGERICWDGTARWNCKLQPRANAAQITSEITSTVVSY